MGETGKMASGLRPDNELTVVCFLWYGDRWGKNDMGPTYVQKLYRGVGRHLSLPFRFVLFCNDWDVKVEADIEVRPLYPSSWKGCLPRLYMYSPEADLTGQVLALDLDIVIVGSLDDIASYQGRFCVRRKFKPGMEHKLDGDIVGFRPPFGLLTLWKPFRENPERIESITGGRERYWYRAAIPRESIDVWQDLYPEQIVSYKRHVRPLGGRLPENARIVSCHGRPRPHEIDEPWIRKYWR